MGTGAPAILVDGRAEDRIPVDDRGLLYGDGVFETLRVVAGRIPLWRWHWRRLTESADRLQLALPAPERLCEEIGQVAHGADAAVRVTVTRRGGPGYAPQPEVGCRRIVARIGPLPEPLDRGLRLTVCKTRLGEQPALAGLKHLCRLEQVLAATEVAESGHDDGLMLDADERVIESTRSNLIALRGEQWVTPELGGCGVAGVYRAFLLDAGVLRIVPLQMQDLRDCRVLCLCNALRGPQWVAEVPGSRPYSPDAAASALSGLPQPW